MIPCLHHLAGASDRNKSGRDKYQWLNGPLPLEDAGIPGHIGPMKEAGIPFIADIHCHFFPVHILRLIWRYFDREYWPIAYRFEEESRRLSALEHNHFRYFTTLHYAHKPGMAADLNDWTARMFSGQPGAVCSGTFYDEPEAERNVRKAVEEYGFRLFKLHCQVSDLDLNSGSLRRSFEYLEERKIPLVIHAGTAPSGGRTTGVKNFLPFLKRFPRLPVVCAHMGAFEMDEFLLLMENFGNLHLDTTMIFTDFRFADYDAEKLFDRIRPHCERIFFGSDFPNIPYRLEHPVLQILQSGLPMPAKHDILYGNFCRLFGINWSGL